MSITGTNNPFPCDPVVFANANAIISLGTITRVGNVFTFSVGFVWKISGVTYQNTAPVVITIAEATEGFNRIDNALLNNANTIELQQGTESDTIALRPTFPDNTILLTTWNVSGDSIGDIVPAESDAAKEDKVSGVIATGTNDYSASGSDLYALVAELKILVTFTNPNTTASTFNYNGLGAFPIVKNYDDAVASGDVKGTMWLRFNGTKWVIVGSVSSSGGSNAVILIQEASQIVNQELDSSKVYIIENQLILTSGQSIIVPSGGLTLVGYGFNVSSIVSSTAGLKVFTSPVGGSGDLILDKFSITNTGTGSQVFDIFDATGEHAIEIEFINFTGCKSLGKINGYRQGTVTTAGLYGCSDGLQLSGAWNGFKVSNTNLFGFGNTGTFIKKDSDTTFANRLFLTSSNFNFPIGSKLSDFISDNLLDNELFQINSCTIRVNDEIDVDLATDLVPNLSANNLKCLWTANNGFPNSANENFIEDTDVSVLFDIDWLKQTYLLTMTGDTEFTESNLPASGKNTQEIKIYLQGDFIPTFPSDWLTKAVGTYKGSDLNEITLKFLKTGIYFMKINNSLSVYPKPSLQSLSPVSLVPSTTTALTINGSFFTPETIVSIENQTVLDVTFVNQGQLIVLVQSSAVEEEVDIIISNGTTVVFAGILPINIGVVTIPNDTNWTNVNPKLDVTQLGKALLVEYPNVRGTGTLNIALPATGNFFVEFKVIKSAIATGALQYNFNDFLDFVSASGTLISNGYLYSPNTSDIRLAFNAGSQFAADFGGQSLGLDPLIKLQRTSGVYYMYVNGVLKDTETELTATAKYLRFGCTQYDITNIRHVLLP